MSATNIAMGKISLYLLVERGINVGEGYFGHACCPPVTFTYFALTIANVDRSRRRFLKNYRIVAYVLDLVCIGMCDAVNLFRES